MVFCLFACVAVAFLSGLGCSDYVEWPLQLYAVAVLFVLQCMADLAVLQWLFWPLFFFCVFFLLLFFLAQVARESCRMSIWLCSEGLQFESRIFLCTDLISLSLGISILCWLVSTQLFAGIVSYIVRWALSTLICVCGTCIHVPSLCLVSQHKMFQFVADVVIVSLKWVATRTVSDIE